MKYLKLFENFNPEEEVSEALASSKLRSVKAIDQYLGGNKNLLKQLYGTYGIAFDKVTDDQVIEMNPMTAYKDRNKGESIVFYVTTREKENPYYSEGGARKFPANSLLAITNGDNLFLGYSWARYGRTGRVRADKSADGAYGVDKRYKGFGASGLYSVKRVAEIADVAYVIPLDQVARTADIQKERAAQKAGAIALIDPKKFKEENLKRYKEIAAQKIAGKDEVSKLVLKAIDEISAQIKGAIESNEVDGYGQPIVGKNNKGRAASVSDAANHMRRIMEAYNDYVSALREAERYSEDGGSRKYYEERSKEKLIDVRSLLNQTSNFGYAW